MPGGAKARALLRFLGGEVAEPGVHAPRGWQTMGKASRDRARTDLCLRLLEKGYYNVFTPHACLRMGTERRTFFDVGREFASYPEDAKVFRRRNARFLPSGDPYYNINLSLKYEDWRPKV